MGSMWNLGRDMCINQSNFAVNDRCYDPTITTKAVD